MTQSTERLDEETERIISATCGEAVWPLELPTDVHVFNAVSALRSRIRHLVSEARKEGAEDVRRRMEQIKSWEAPR